MTQPTVQQLEILEKLARENEQWIIGWRGPKRVWLQQEGVFREPLSLSSVRHMHRNGWITPVSGGEKLFLSKSFAFGITESGRRLTAANLEDRAPA